MILRTTLMFGILTAIFLAIGLFFGGVTGMLISLIFSVMVNILSYWFSDRFVLAMYKAKPLEGKNAKKLEAIIEELAAKAKIPKPRMYLVEMDAPNAFATGRSPEHAVVAVTSGLMESLNTGEIKGVLAHEISHIKHRDILLNSMAASIAGALTWLGYIFFYGNEENRNIVSYVILFIMAPVAALLVRLAISRNREFFADKEGADISNPLDLASALEKISFSAKSRPLRSNPSSSHMFIINPFSAGAIAGIFSTHPPVEARVARLRNMAIR